MAKAVVCITGCAMSGPGTILIGAHVSVDQGLPQNPHGEPNGNYSLNMDLSHTASATQMILAVRNRVVADVAAFGGPALGLTDIQVFGGPV